MEISRIYCLPIFRDDTIHQEEADKLAFLHELKEVACKKCKEMIVQETQRAKQEIKINQTKRELKVKEEKIK